MNPNTTAVGVDADQMNPLGEIYTVPGMAGGALATVAYVAFQGSSYATATDLMPLLFAQMQVVLTEPPTPPKEAMLGTRTILIGYSGSCIPPWEGFTYTTNSGTATITG